MRVFVASHVNAAMPVTQYAAPLQVGAVTKAPWDGFLADNTGHHISGKNPSYCELTALYWIWKNVTDDRVGLCHYRRFFSPVLFAEQEAGGVKVGLDLAQTLLGIDTNGTLFDVELAFADIVLPTRVPWPEAISRTYAKVHRPADWDAMLAAVADLYPDEVGPMKNFFDQPQRMHYCNMFIANKAVIDRYCAWLFPLMAAIEERITVASDPYQGRVFGFLSERLFNWWTASRPLRIIERPLLHIA